ncbi:MAG: response regulator transcription factor [Chthoniobacteraceae bacterium]
MAIGNNKILVADDEADVLNLVSLHLKNAGFNVIKAEDGAAALRKARRSLPALLVLDLMLPDMSGLEVCKALKADSATSQIFIIMLTAKAEEVDRILGLELGADDYLTKPFSPRELVLRVKSVLRHEASRKEKPNSIKIGDIEVDRLGFEVRIKGEVLKLTPTEYKLLIILMERLGKVVTRDVLLDEVWGYEQDLDTRTVDTYVARLREKIVKGQVNIDTIRGFGYQIKEIANNASGVETQN